MILNQNDQEMPIHSKKEKNRKKQELKEKLESSPSLRSNLYPGRQLSDILEELKQFGDRAPRGRGWLQEIRLE